MGRKQWRDDGRGRRDVRGRERTTDNIVRGWMTAEHWRRLPSAQLQASTARFLFPSLFTFHHFSVLFFPPAILQMWCILKTLARGFFFVFPPIKSPTPTYLYLQPASQSASERYWLARRRDPLRWESEKQLIQEKTQSHPQTVSPR